MGEVIIMRGPAGSGKSTWVEENCPDAVVVSADQFFIQTEYFQRIEGMDGGPTGSREVYDFDITKLAEAHQDCLCRFIDALITKEAQIVVDNTNIHYWEYDSYFKLARNYSYEVRIVEFRPKTLNDIDTCIQRNTHNVPKEIVTKMCLEFEADPRSSEIYEITS